MNQKGFAPLILLIAVVAIAIIGALAFISHKTSKKTYTDSTVGISFEYPSSLTLNKQNQNDLSLGAGVEKIEDIEENIPFRWDRTTAKKDEAQLATGSFGEIIGTPLKESENVIKIGNTYAKTFTEIGQVVDVCGSIYQRNLILYKNGYRFSLSLSIPEKLLVDSIPDYFTTDKANCVDSKIFKTSDTSRLYQALSKKQLSGPVQEWFNTFDNMVKTIKTN